MFKVKLKPSLHYKPWSVLRLDFGSVNTLCPGIGLEIWAHINRWPMPAICQCKHFRPGRGPYFYGNMGRSSDIQRQTREKRVQKSVDFIRYFLLLRFFNKNKYTNHNKIHGSAIL